MDLQLTNRAGNYRFSATRVHQPGTDDEIRELVLGARKLRVIGTRNSLNDIADSGEDLVSLERFNRVVSIDRDRERPAVTIEAGVTYGQLCRVLHDAG